MTNNCARQATEVQAGAPPTSRPEPAPPTAAEAGRAEPAPSSSFPIVGVGASAGGLEAFTQLLGALPGDTGAALVLIQHLDPTHESKLAGLLARATPMPVLEATQDLAIRPDHVYVIPKNTTLTIAQGVLQLAPRGKARGPHLPIDLFFKALAEDQQSAAIGVILSGTGSDGTLGLGEIKAAGGITFAQDKDSAKHDGMPQSAVASGSVDFILPPEKIARELARIGRHPYLAPARTAECGPADAPEEPFRKILSLLRSAFGVDFTHYRDTTIRRRTMRRMALHAKESLADYGRQLEEDPSELQALYQDILINVTSFFRDPAMFEALKSSIFPEIIKTKSGGEPVRVWTAGCSTGQEAYSLAIALVESLDDKPVRPPSQIFATDLSDTVSLEKARAGLYPESIEAEVSPERLRRFFAKEDGKYRISKSIRDMCVFARQNILADPPFSRVDLISCRNVLIYLAPPVQKRVIPTFHYALNPTGFLMLGTSETIGEFSDLFAVVDKTHKIYSKKPTAFRQYPHFNAGEYLARVPGETRGAPRPSPNPADLQTEADRIVLGRYAPAGVLVNDSLEILQFRGRTSPYLECSPGSASLNLLKMAREGLFVELKSALDEAKKGSETVERSGVRVRDDGHVREVNLKVARVKLPGMSECCFLVLFEEARLPSGHEATAAGRAAGPRSGKAARAGSWIKRLFASRHAVREATEGLTPPDGHELLQLRRELAAAREQQQLIMEQHDAANEELKSANEEILSSNEELQSTNQELETAKEELQSVNEELTTVNEQLQTRNQELTRLNDDSTNLFGSGNVPMVVLGIDLRLRRFTPAAGKVLNLLPADVGRPIGDLRLTVEVPDLEQLLLDVIATVQVKEREVRDREGRWHALRIHPYRTADNKIDGAVMVLTDIDETKSAQVRLKEAGDYARAIVETVREPLLILTADLRVNSANQSFYDTFQVTPRETENQFLYDLGGRQWDTSPLRTLLKDILRNDLAFEDFEVEHELPGLGRRVMLLNARRLLQQDGATHLILLALEDITERKAAEVLVDSQRQALQLLAEGAPLEDALEFLIGVVERQSAQGMLASIVPLNEAGTHFQRGIGPSLPDAFNAAVEGMAVSSPTGLCAHAVRRREAVAVHDFNEGTAWQPFGKFVAPYGLCSGWSVPIISFSGQMLGTFANYYRHAADPTPANRELVDMVVRTAAIAIERKRAEEALRESEERYRTLIGQVKDYAIFRTDREGLATTWNEGVKRVLGFEEAHFVGKDIVPLIFTPEDVQSGAAQRELEQAAATGHASSDRWMVKIDGTSFYAMGTTTALRDVEGKLTGFTKVMRDQTDRKRLEDELRQSSTDLFEADRRKNEFLAMLAHELRNPLAAISNAVQLSVRAEADADAVAWSKEVIERQAKNLARLVEDLLDVSRITQGKVQLRKEPVELGPLVARAVDAVRHRIDDRKHEFSVSVPEKPVRLQADSTRLEQVLMNLLNNAAKYTETGGRIGLEVEREGKEVVIAVRDSGVGISPEMLPHVFDLFTQVEHSRDSSHGGLGIGLTLVRSLVEMHGGGVSAASTPGQGSVFTVRLPLGEVPPEECPEPTTSSAAGTRTQRILVVDDNADTAHSMALLLRHAGHDVQTAQDGPSAIKAARTHRPEAVILDIGLPGMSGYEVAKRIRAEAGLSGALIIAVSGHGQEDDRKRSKEAGFDHHLVKPIDHHALSTLLTASSQEC